MPEKVIHEIRLNQYIAYPADRTRRFCLGTRDSYGVEQLRIVPGEGWDGLTITATFHPPEGEAVQVLVPADGLIDVPPEATRSGSELPLKYGKIVFAGVADGMQRISCNLPYTVLDHAPVEGAESSGPAPSWYEQAAAHFLPGGGKAGQVLAKASDADLDVEWADGGGSGTSDHAKLSNRDAADQHPISAITGLQKELDGKQPAGNYLTADTLQAATDAALAQAKATGEFDGEQGPKGDTGLRGEKGDTGPQGPKGDTGAAGATGPAGADGISPHIGSNGNWYLGETDTGKPSRGETGPAGADGRDGADGQPGENGTDGYSPTANVTQTDNGATITITDKNGTTTATVTNGKDGADGNPGADGSPGKDGVDGKTAYQYAVGGGYTGTEEEFAAKLAEEMPTALPNPNALTFAGAVTGSYDGSAPVTVNIPVGGANPEGGYPAGVTFARIAEGTIAAGTESTAAIDTGVTWADVKDYDWFEIGIGTNTNSGLIYYFNRNSSPPAAWAKIKFSSYIGHSLFKKVADNIYERYYQNDTVAGSGGISGTNTGINANGDTPTYRDRKLYQFNWADEDKFYIYSSGTVKNDQTFTFTGIKFE